jgi:hypothetical protein
MKRILSVAAVVLLCVAGVCLAQTARKESEMEKRIAGISAALETIATNQAKLDKILANQDTIVHMLKIQRWR